MKTSLMALLLFMNLHVIAQTEKELEKMILDAQRQADSMLQAANQEIQSLPSNGARKARALPPRKSALIASIPSGVFNKAQMQAYLLSLEPWMNKNISPAAIREAKRVSANTNGLTEKAVALWYNTAAAEAVYVGYMAAKQKPSDPLALSNLGSLLTLAGAPEKAVPVLRTVANYYPSNAMVLNNLGQAFAALGDGDSAMVYLGRCVQIATYHPEANLTAGVIAKWRGNTTVANKYIKNSIKAANRASSLDEFDNSSGEDMLKMIRRKVKMPAYFNPYKIEFPKQCENVADAVRAGKEYKEFQLMLEALIRKYEAVRDQMEQQMEVKIEQLRRDVMKDPTAFANKPQNYVRPFAEAATKFLAVLSVKNMESEAIYGKMIHDREEAIDKRVKQYNEEIRNMETCEAQIAAANRCMRDCAAIRRDIQEKVRSHEAMRYEIYSYYGYLSGYNKETGTAVFYDWAAYYLKSLLKVSWTVIESPCGETDPGEVPEPDPEATAKPECPFDIDIDLLAIKIGADCDKLSFSGGQGLQFKYEKNFNNGETTLSVGAGLGFSKSVDMFDIASAEAAVELSQSFYITFDGNNNFSDIGLQFSASAGISAGAEIGIGNDVVSMDQTLIANHGVSAGAGYKLGLNTGFTFEGGYGAGVED